MIQVRFFASIREQLGCDQLSLPAEGLSTVAQVLDALVAQHGESWQAVLQGQRVLVAVNQSMASVDAAVQAGDEVAFFPPVTGG